MKKNYVGVCLIGAGRAGMIHAANFKTRVPNAKLVAVADPVEEAVKKACHDLGIPKYYLDYKEALRDDEIDAVVVVAPTVFHREIVVNAAIAGKHIFCEKPMAMDESECEQMIQTADANRVKLQIGFMRRFDESYIQAKEIIAAGDIGDVVLVKSLTRGPSIPQKWTYDLKKSNGPLAEVNSHDIDTLRWFTEGEFDSVYALGGNYRCPEALPDFPDYYDNVIMNATFTNKKQGVIDGAVSVKYGYDARVEILGTKGVIFLGQVHQKTVVVCNQDRGMVRPVMNSWRFLFKDAYLAEDIHFIQCILNDEKPRVTGIDGKMAVKVVEAGNLSIREKRIVKLEY
ncbi:MAG: Gfo/Idh/MocA family oxidoreductase [Bacillota bacterium]